MDGACWLCFLLPTFTRLGHECQGFFESMRWNACVLTLDLSSEISFGGMESEPTFTPRAKFPQPSKILLRGGWNPRRCIKHDSEPNTLPTSYSDPCSWSKRSGAGIDGGRRPINAGSNRLQHQSSTNQSS